MIVGGGGGPKPSHGLGPGMVLIRLCQCGASENAEQKIFKYKGDAYLLNE